MSALNSNNSYSLDNILSTIGAKQSKAKARISCLSLI